LANVVTLEEATSFLVSRFSFLVSRFSLRFLIDGTVNPDDAANNTDTCLQRVTDIEKCGSVFCVVEAKYSNCVNCSIKLRVAHTRCHLPQEFCGGGSQLAITSR
jgi:hypothetical protein